MGWTRFYLRRHIAKIGNAYEMRTLEDQRKELERNEASGARWRRNPDLTWARWSYLGNSWEPAAAPEQLLELARSAPSDAEWIRIPYGGWEQVENDPAGVLPPPPRPDLLASRQTRPPPAPAATPDPWRDVPASRPEREGPSRT